MEDTSKLELPSQSKQASKLLRSESFANLGITEPTLTQQEIIRANIESKLLESLKTPNPFSLGDLLPNIAQATELIVQDDFSKCFQENIPEPWNWNVYLYVCWALGVVLRYLILLPLRFAALILGFILFGIGFTLVRICVKNNKKLRQSLERRLIQFLCGAFVLSWHGVIKYHGVIPKRAPNQIYVANHTSMIDVRR
jgi:glycerol-3-phosphate O-acyltransferase 3/4